MRKFKVCSVQCFFIIEAEEVRVDGDYLLEFIANRQLVSQFRNWDFWFELYDKED